MKAAHSTALILFGLWVEIILIYRYISGQAHLD